MQIKIDKIVPVKSIPNEKPVDHISFSQVSMYLRCPKQYEFSYVKKLPRIPNMALAIGKGGHTALEYNAKQKIKTKKDLDTSDLLDLTSDFIDSETADVEDKKERQGGQTKDRAIAGIRIYRERDAPKIMPAGVEVPFMLNLNETEEDNIEPIRIVKGYIDVIDTGEKVSDYKFVNKRRGQAEVDLSPQLTLYSKVFHKLTGRYPAKVGYQMFLPGNKKEAPDSEFISRTAALMTPEAQEKRFRRLRYQFQMVERGIRAGVFPPTDNPQTCSYCDFRTRCQDSLAPDDFIAAKLRGEL